MTIVEYLQSDTDVLKVIAISLGSVVVCVIALWLLAVRCSGWRKTQGKRKQLQRPFVTKRISLTPRDGSPTFRYGPFNHWSQDKWPFSPRKSLLWTPPSPANLENPFFKSSSTNCQSKTERSVSPRFLGQIISCINKSNPKSPTLGKTSSRKGSPIHRLSPIKDYKNPFILDQSTTDDQDSTLPSLLLSSDSSTDYIMERSVSDDVIEVEHQPMPTTKVDKGVNTDINPEDNKMNNNNKALARDKEIRLLRENRKNRFPIQNLRDDFTLRLWSHKCPLPCHSKVQQRIPYSYTWSCDSSSSGDPQTHPDEQDEQDDRQDYSKYSERSQDNMKRFSGDKFSTRKCAADVCVQTEFSGEIQQVYDRKQENSPLCSSDSTLKENDSAVKCCCRSDHKTAKHSKSHNKLKTFSVVNKMASDHVGDSKILESGLSISDRTSFIPAKSWYSLGSLCDEDENCKTCGRNFSSISHHNHHAHSDDSDTKLNLSTIDAVSYNDTGYTSTEEESETNSDHSKDMSSCEHHSSPENGSYDGDYESDDEIFHCRLVASDDMVYKPLPSISEPFAIETYAAREWTSDTPKAKAIREGYAAIPNHVSCHQLRQIRGDNYCAIRAALFQSLINGIPVLDKLPKDGASQVLRKLIACTRGALQEWSFAGRIDVEKDNVMSTLEEILVFYVDKVNKCEELSSKQAKTDYLLSLFNEESGNSEFRLLEAVKLIMLYHAVQLYEDINQGNEVPTLAWLVFARDTSTDPQRLLRNHLNCVGDSGGLEQVEMCLLGYALGVVIQVFRPSQVNKQDFIANYPYLEDVPPLTPTVSLVAEDDRHYNIVVE